MNKDQQKVLLERLDNLQKTIDRVDRDLANDRRDLQEFTLRVGSLEGVIEELRKGQKTMANQVHDKVEDLVQPLSDQIENKKIVVIKGSPFWKKLFGKG